MSLARILLCLALLARATSACALEPSADGRHRAKVLAQDAWEAFGRQDYLRARDLFLAAHHLYPHPNLLYSLGRVEERRGDSSAAAAHYQAFLDHGGGAPDRVRDARDSLTVLHRRLKSPRARAAAVAVLANAPARAQLVQPALPERPLRVLKWVAGATGVALLVTGAALYTIDGRGTCGALACPEIYNTAAGGIALLATGATLGGVSALFFGLDLRAARAEERALAVSVRGKF